jgi:hypothetical protein
MRRPCASFLVEGIRLWGPLHGEGRYSKDIKIFPEKNYT